MSLTSIIALRLPADSSVPKVATPRVWWRYANRFRRYDIRRAMSADFAVVVDTAGHIKAARRLIGLERNRAEQIRLTGVPVEIGGVGRLSAVRAPVTYLNLADLPVAYRRSRSEVRSLAEHWQQWERRYGGTHALFGDTSPVWIGQQLENLPASRVLELGAGEGRIALDLARRGHRVTAVDISTTATSRMAEQARELGLTLEIVTGDALRWLDSPSANRSWDVAVMQCFSAGSREATRAVLSILADRAHALIMENAAIVTTPADVYETWSPAATAELVEAQISLTRVSTLSVSAQPSK